LKLIAGLGNMGEKYLFTRHNAGFMLLDKLALEYGFSYKEDKNLKSLVARARLFDDEFILIKPITFMNLSGDALIAVMNYYKIDVKDIIVVFDDLSLDVGKIRFRPSGSDGGHNGIKSIIKNIKTSDFARLKIGIGPQPPVPAENFVLQNFKKEELDELKDALERGIKGIECYYKEGMERAQNCYN